ncbi:MAG TPA: hypothetical protein VIJ59_08100 [Caulobacteraceae bacterium]
MTELEDLRADWVERDQSLAAAIRLHAGLLRESLTEQRLEKVRRYGAMRGVDLLIWISFLAAFGMFLVRSFGDWKFFVPAAALQLWTLVMGVVTIREREALRAVDFGEPPRKVQLQLARLRLERARTVQWALLTGQLVWWIPLAIVAFKGLLGVDLYTVSAFMPTFMAINLAVGVVFIPVALLSARVIGPLLADTRFSRSLIDAITGRDLAEAQAMAKRIGSFQ